MKSRVVFISILITLLAISIVANASSLEKLNLICFAQSRFDATIGEVSTDGATETKLTQDRFTVSRVRIRATGKLPKTLSFFVQMDAASSPALKDARLRVGLGKDIPLTIEAGRFLLPFGFQTPINPYNLPSVDYNLVIHNGAKTGLMQGLWDVGIKAYGKHALDNRLTLDYVGAVVNGQTGGFTDVNKSKDLVGRVGLAFKQEKASVAVGGSAYIGKTPVMKEGVWTGEDTTRNRFGADLQIEVSSLQLQSEVLMGKNDETNALGLYATLAYPVIPKLQLVAGVDLLDVDTDQDGGDTLQLRAGTNIALAESNKLQIFYQQTQKKAVGATESTTEHKLLAQLALVFDTTFGK